MAKNDVTGTTTGDLEDRLIEILDGHKTHKNRFERVSGEMMEVLAALAEAAPGLIMVKMQDDDVEFLETFRKLGSLAVELQEAVGDHNDDLSKIIDVVQDILKSTWGEG